MSTPFNSTPHSPHADLLRRLGLVFLTTLIVAASFALIYRVNATFLPLALTFAFATGLGLASGFSARWILRGRPGLLRWLVALTALTLGLSLLGLVTRGVTGLKLFNRATMDPDWSGLGQIVLGAVAAWLALRSWRTVTPPQSISREPELASSTTRQAPAAKASRHREEVADAPRRRLHWPTIPRVRLPTVSRPRFRLASRLGRNQVRLERDEEHRCPYCLEPVSRNDPRGFVVCKICHTYHHADCWAVTGMCQVPHHHD